MGILLHIWMSKYIHGPCARHVRIAVLEWKYVPIQKHAVYMYISRGICEFLALITFKCTAIIPYFFLFCFLSFIPISDRGPLDVSPYTHYQNWNNTKIELWTAVTVSDQYVFIWKKKWQFFIDISALKAISYMFTVKCLCEPMSRSRIGPLREIICLST